MSAPKWAVGMQRLAPGVYAAKDGALHLDEAELCQVAGVPYTERNAEMLRKAAREVFQGAETEVREDP